MNTQSRWQYIPGSFSCQPDDDVDYVLKYSGEENRVIGTDYGHNDQSTEIEALRNLKTRRHRAAAVREDYL